MTHWKWTSLVEHTCMDTHRFVYSLYFPLTRKTVAYQGRRQGVFLTEIQVTYLIHSRPQCTHCRPEYACSEIVISVLEQTTRDNTRESQSHVRQSSPHSGDSPVSHRCPPVLTTSLHSTKNIYSWLLDSLGCSSFINVCDTHAQKTTSTVQSM